MTVSEIAFIALKVLLILYILSSLSKFVVHFFVKYETRIKKIKSYYSNEGRTISLFDDIIILFMLLFVVLLFISGEMEYLSFTTGFLIGMTILQVYFHRFRKPLSADKSPGPHAPPIKYMSFAIQDKPKRAWKEYLIMSIILFWSLYMLLSTLF